MFYIVNAQKPHLEAVLGTVEFQRIIQDYIIDTSELTFDQYQLFIGTLVALDLYKELIPNDTSHYVVRFSPNE